MKRVERIAVDTRRLAEKALFETGIVCMQAVPIAAGTKLSICTAAERKNRSGARDYWFRSRKDADKILDEVISREKRARMTEGGGVLVTAPIDHVGAVITKCIEYLGHSFIPIIPITTDEIEAAIANIRKDIDRAVVKLQRKGALQDLNRQYKTLPDGKPSYRVWATEQLEPQLLQLVGGLDGYDRKTIRSRAGI